MRMTYSWKPLPARKYIKSFILMNNNIIQIFISLGERLCTECMEASGRPILVRGHFRVVNGKKVYVKAHYRKR